MALKDETLSNEVLCCFYNVYNRLGYGFLEKVYERALLLALKAQGLQARSQVPISVRFMDHVIGEYFADILVENRLLLEIKAANSLRPEHEAQLLNYLTASKIEIGLLLNFGPRPQVKRKICSNS